MALSDHEQSSFRMETINHKQLSGTVACVLTESGHDLRLSDAEASGRGDVNGAVGADRRVLAAGAADGEAVL